MIDRRPGRSSSAGKAVATAEVRRRREEERGSIVEVEVVDDGRGWKRRERRERNEVEFELANPEGGLGKREHEVMLEPSWTL